MRIKLGAVNMDDIDLHLDSTVKISNNVGIAIPITKGDNTGYLILSSSDIELFRTIFTRGKL